jgi:hypothetical protein
MTGPAAGAGIVGHLGDILSSEKDPKIIAITEHRQAVRTIAVADGADERGLEGPDGVYQPLLFEGSMQIQRFRLGDAVKVAIFGTAPEGFQEDLL